MHVTTLQTENNKNSIPCKFECFFHNLNYNHLFCFSSSLNYGSPFVFIQLKRRKIKSRACIILPSSPKFVSDWQTFQTEKISFKLFPRYWLRNSSNLTLSTTISKNIVLIENPEQKNTSIEILGQKINGCIDNNKPHKWKLKLWRKTK